MGANLFAQAIGNLFAQQQPPANLFSGTPSKDDWQGNYNANFAKNQQYAVPDKTYQTDLKPADEQAFRDWVAQNKVPFNPNEPTQDYDMRGYWKDIASQGNNETAINPNDQQLHFPDTYKTPYHQSFSGESKYAKPGGPVWINDHQLADPRTGAILFDETRK